MQGRTGAFMGAMLRRMFLIFCWDFQFVHFYLFDKKDVPLLAQVVHTAPRKSIPIFEPLVLQLEINETLLKSLGSSCQSPLGTAVLLSVSVGCRFLRAHGTQVPGFRQQRGGRSTGSGLNRGYLFIPCTQICNAYTA